MPENINFHTISENFVEKSLCAVAEVPIQGCAERHDGN